MDQNELSQGANCAVPARRYPLLMLVINVYMNKEYRRLDARDNRTSATMSSAISELFV